MKSLLPALLVSTALAALTTRALDLDDFDTDLSLKPSTLHGSADGKLAGALKFDGRLRYDLAPSRVDGFSVVADTKGTLATEAQANSENLYAGVELGWAHLHESWTTLTNANRTSQRPGARPVEKLEYQLGWLLDVFFKTRFETDQQFDNYNVTYGPKIGFTPIHRTTFVRQLVPFLYVDYQRVEVLKSDDFVARGIDEDAFWRLDVSANWDLDVGGQFLNHVRWLRPISLGFDLHYYRAFDLPDGAEEAGFDDGLYYAGTFNYNFRALYDEVPAKWTDWIPLVYCSVGHGRLPPTLEEQTMVFVGIVYHWAKPRRE